MHNFNKTFFTSSTAFPLTPAPMTVCKPWPTQHGSQDQGSPSVTHVWLNTEQHTEPAGTRTLMQKAERTKP